MNWGFRIVVLYMSFVALILTLVFKANGEKVELVTKDYYAQELVHTQKMNAVERGLTYKDQIHIHVDNDGVQLTFPEELQQIEGKVDFYRPSDSALDQHFPLTIDSTLHQVVSTASWKMGYYAIKIEWTMGKENYLIEDTIFIP